MKSPLFQLEQIDNTNYLTLSGDRKLSLKEWLKINRSEKALSKSIDDPIRWVFAEWEGEEHPVLLKKSVDGFVILSKPFYLQKARTEKDLAYWKKKLIEALNRDISKSLDDILYPDGVPELAKSLLEKARGFPTGTIRTWSGKEYKKMSSGKWVRTYSETESRGAKQAIRNVQKKIEAATSMEELLKIVQENMSRFKDEDGKTLPIVAEFLKAARGTEAGKKPVVKEPEAKGSVPKLTEAEKKAWLEKYEAKQKEKLDVLESGEGKGEKPDTNYEAQKEKSEKRNSFDIGSEVEVNGKNGTIVGMGRDKDGFFYNVDIDGVTEKHYKIALKPYTGEKAQKAIEEANPSNRTKKTMEISGTVEEPKTEPEVLKQESVSTVKPESFEMEMSLGNKSGTIKGKDYTQVDQREILLVAYDTIKNAGEDYLSVKPDWMPEVDMKAFAYTYHALLFAELPDGNYLVPNDHLYATAGLRFLKVGDKEVELDNFKREYSKLTLAQVAATQDFYRKVGKAKLDRDYQERVAYYKEKGYRGKPSKSRLKVLQSGKTTSMHHNFVTDVAPDAKSVYQLSAKLKQKTIDMDIMKEEVDNTFSKGRETAYGDSNTSDALQSDYGVKIKMQDGSAVSQEDQKYLADSMASVQKTFGQRNSMNEKFGLKLSFAKGTAMHARKAVGLFVPTQHAIGISDGKGLQKKNRITGEMMTVDYGDENFGGFVLSHEYAHMMDFYLGSKGGEWYSSDKEGSISNQIASTFRDNMNEESNSNYINRTCECFARALEQYHAIESTNTEAKAFFAPYIESPQYVNQANYETKIKPLVEQFFKENDALLKSIKIEI